MNVGKDVKQMLRTIRRNGYIVNNQAKHYKILDEEGRFLVGVSRTPVTPLP
jgi:hypothetical protein